MITPTEFTESVLRTLSPTNRDLVQVCLGLADETGELSGAVKKWRAQGHDLDLTNVKEELGDALYYIVMGCIVCNFTLEEVMEYNRDKLTRRYPEGFDPDRSINRTV
jgi:NTP pyrophosphatase (non-canonical NTP hydrolase)